MPDSPGAGFEIARVAGLGGTTLQLAGLTFLIAGPLSAVLAFLLMRTNLPGRRTAIGILAFGAFVPLPLFALSWQGIARGIANPWAVGLVPAAFIHAMAAIPWLTGLIALGLVSRDRTRDDDLRTHTSDTGQLRFLFRDALPAILLSSWWVVIQTAGEITVTDLAQVRTYAEEIYTEFVAGGDDALSRAFGRALPVCGVVALLVVISLKASGIEWHQFGRGGESRRIDLGAWKLPVAFLVGLFLAIWGGVPLVGLITQAAGSDSPSGVSLQRFTIEVPRAARLHAALIADSLLWSFATAAITIGLVVWLLWKTIDSPRLQMAVLGGSVILWTLPGPVIAFALKWTIDGILDWEETLSGGTFFRTLLYDGPTPVPVMIAQILRLWPYAIAVLLPAFGAVSRTLRETARIDGADRRREFRLCVWPIIRRNVIAGIVAGTALCLGELSAGKPVQVPGRLTYAQELFNQLHYGSTATTASLALVMLVPIGGLLLLLRGSLNR